jgi:hypothetical protein
MTIYLHAGTHKTGSKSFQAVIAENREALARLGYDVFHGTQRNPRNHTELHLAALRSQRDSLAKHNWPEMIFGAAFEDKVQSSVQGFLKGSMLPHQVFSNEDLSFLRYPDEFARLLRLFGRPSDQFVVVLTLRNKADFLTSFRTQILKKPGRVPLQDPASALYVEEDSWLVDYNALICAFRGVFCHVRVIDYDKATGCDGSVLPALLRAIDVDPSAFAWTDLRLNVSR